MNTLIKSLVARKEPSAEEVEAIARANDALKHRVEQLIARSVQRAAA